VLPPAREQEAAAEVGLEADSAPAAAVRPDVPLAVRLEAVLRQAASAVAVRPEAKMFRRPRRPHHPRPLVALLLRPRRLPASAAAVRALRRSSWRRASFRAVTSA